MINYRRLVILIVVILLLGYWFRESFCQERETFSKHSIEINDARLFPIKYRGNSDGYLVVKVKEDGADTEVVIPRDKEDSLMEFNDYLASMFRDIVMNGKVKEGRSVSPIFFLIDDNRHIYVKPDSEGYPETHLIGTEEAEEIEKKFRDELKNGENPIMLPANPKKMVMPKPIPRPMPIPIADNPEEINPIKLRVDDETGQTYLMVIQQGVESEIPVGGKQISRLQDGLDELIEVFRIRIEKLRNGQEVQTLPPMIMHLDSYSHVYIRDDSEGYPETLLINNKEKEHIEKKYYEKLDAGLIQPFKPPRRHIPKPEPMHIAEIDMDHGIPVSPGLGLMQGISEEGHLLRQCTVQCWGDSRCEEIDEEYNSQCYNGCLDDCLMEIPNSRDMIDHQRIKKPIIID